MTDLSDCSLKEEGECSDEEEEETKSKVTGENEEVNEFEHNQKGPVHSRLGPLNQSLVSGRGLNLPSSTIRRRSRDENQGGAFWQKLKDAGGRGFIRQGRPETENMYDEYGRPKYPLTMSRQGIVTRPRVAIPSGDVNKSLTEMTAAKRGKKKKKKCIFVCDFCPLLIHSYTNT